MNKEDFPIPEDAPDEVKEALSGLRDMILHSVGEDSKDAQVNVLIEQLEAIIKKFQDNNITFILSCAIEVDQGLRRVCAMCGNDPVQLLGMLEASAHGNKELVLKKLSDTTQDRNA